MKRKHTREYRDSAQAPRYRIRKAKIQLKLNSVMDRKALRVLTHASSAKERLGKVWAHH